MQKLRHTAVSPRPAASAPPRPPRPPRPDDVHRLISASYSDDPSVQQRGSAVNAIAHRRAALLLCLLGSPCLAHHGVAPHYDADRPVTIEGVVAKFDFINPHSFVHIAAVDDAGNEQVWECELASRSVLTRNGLTAELFKTGERIKLESSKASRAGKIRRAAPCASLILRTAAFFGARRCSDPRPHRPKKSRPMRVPCSARGR
jgi:hypothetical protein